MTKKAVVLFNLGGPSSLDEVGPFLFSLFYDPAILDVPNPLRYFLAKLISKRRLKEACKIYSLLGGASPLLENTNQQAQALESRLGKDYRVFVTMRHAQPRSKEVLQQVIRYKPEEIILLPLYPQYSTTTTESAFRDWKRVCGECNFPLRFISEYPDEEGFILAMKDLTFPLLKEAQKIGEPKLLLTAHGLPEKTIRKGDPYQIQVEKTAEKLIQALGIPSLDVTLCYQSRVGPLKWIGPYTDDQIILAAQKKRPIVVVPISFVSEHSETLVELDVEYRDLAIDMGCPAYFRVPTVQTNPFFIQALANLVQKNTKPLEVSRAC